MHGLMNMKHLILGEIENLRRKINRGECKKVKKYAEIHERKEDENVFEKIIDWNRSTRRFKKKKIRNKIK